MGGERKRKKGGKKPKRNIQSAPLMAAKLIILIWSDLANNANVNLMDENFSICFWKIVQGCQFQQAEDMVWRLWTVGQCVPCCGWSGLDWCWDADVVGNRIFTVSHFLYVWSIALEIVFFSKIIWIKYKIPSYLPVQVSHLTVVMKG